MAEIFLELNGAELRTTDEEIVAVLARLAGSHSAASTGTAIQVFLAIWCVVAAGNMWIGVAQAGYSFQEELPIFLLIILLPAAAAVFIKW